jgi:hypothetical protein
MTFRSLGAAACGLAFAGTVFAQQTAPKPTGFPQSSFPTRAGSTQIPASAASTAGTPAGNGLMPTTTAPAQLSSPYADSGTTPCATGDCLPAQSCGTACDCMCGPPGRVWVSAQWLYWTARGQNLPPLITTSPNGTPRDQAGVLGAPGTQTLFGGNRVNDNFRNGLMIRAGMWLDDCQRFGIEANFFFLGDSGTGTNVGSNGSQILARPFTDALTQNPSSQLVSFGKPDSQLVSYPGVLAGSVGVRATSSLIGGGLNFLCNVCCDPCSRTDFLYGFQYLNLRDEVTINENLTALPGANVPAGTRFLIQDRVRTSNNFYGANLGLYHERRFGHFFLGVRPAVALGVTNTFVTIDGTTQIIDPQGNATTYPGGLLTQNSNIRSYNSNHFSVVPSIGVQAGVQLTEHLRAFVSYNFIYWNNVARAGDQFDTRVNTNQIAPSVAAGGPPLPAYHLVRDNYWVQGVGVGLQYRY